MKNYIKLLIITASLITTNLFAQQDPQSSAYMFNPMGINPAYAGSNIDLQSNLIYRSQWTGISGAPSTFTANAHKAYFNEKVGAGITLSNDDIGAAKRLQMGMAGSYHLKFPTFRLSFGLQLNLSQYNIGLSTVQHSIDGSVDNAFSSNLKETTFNFGTGAFAYAKNWYAGISIPHFRKNVLSVNTTELNLTAFEAPHFYLQGGYMYDLNPMITLKPNTLVKYVKGAPINADFNLNMYYKKTYGVGLGYRTDNSMIAMLEIQANTNWKFGYAFDYTLSDLATYSNNSHELFVRYALGPKGTHLSPRLY